MNYKHMQQSLKAARHALTDQNRDARSAIRGVDPNNFRELVAIVEYVNGEDWADPHSVLDRAIAYTEVFAE